MDQDSILVQPFVDKIMILAKQNMERDGGLCPMLFVRLSDNQRMVVAVKIGATPNEKRAQFAELGKSLRQNGQEINEAMLLSEGWCVKVSKDTMPLAVLPSEHPERQEAIVIVGRDAEGKRFCSVVEPFGRSPEHKPLWGDPVETKYSELSGEGVKSESLLDELFISSSEVKGGELHD